VIPEAPRPTFGLGPGGPELRGGGTGPKGFLRHRNHGVLGQYRNILGGGGATKGKKTAQEPGGGGRCEEVSFPAGSREAKKTRRSCSGFSSNRIPPFFAWGIGTPGNGGPGQCYGGPHSRHRARSSKRAPRGGEPTEKRKGRVGDLSPIVGGAARCLAGGGGGGGATARRFRPAGWGNSGRTALFRGPRRWQTMDEKRGGGKSQKAGVFLGGGGGRPPPSKKTPRGWGGLGALGHWGGGGGGPKADFTRFGKKTVGGGGGGGEQGPNPGWGWVGGNRLIENGGGGVRGPVVGWLRLSGGAGGGGKTAPF